MGKFSKENKFLVGISLDGDKDIHNLNRLDYKNDYKYIQFNPYLETFENTSMTLERYSLTSILFKTSNLWYTDALNNNYVGIRLFDNILGLFLKQEHESCDMRGVCSCQHIKEQLTF